MYIVLYKPHHALELDAVAYGPFATEEEAYEFHCTLPAIGIYCDQECNGPHGYKYTKELTAPSVRDDTTTSYTEAAKEDAERDERLKLFNCCTHLAEPDWSRFEYLELTGCRNDNDPDDDETNIIGNIEVHLAEFFTVYGRDKEGLAEAITDTSGNSAKQALHIAATLSLRSGLKCIIAPSLMIGAMS